MNKATNITKELFDLLVDYFDVSALQPPIKVGDPLHVAICSYRAALPSGHRPPGEANMIRRLLALSRSDDIDKRSESQSVDARWAKTLAEKYPGVCDDESVARDLDVKTPRMPANLTPAQQDIYNLVVRHGRRMTTVEIASCLEADHKPQGKSTLKQNLAVLSAQRKIIPWTKSGYGLPGCFHFYLSQDLYVVFCKDGI